MAFPKPHELKKIRKKLEKMEGTLLPPPGATPLELFRWEICQKFVEYKNKKDLTLDEMGNILGIDKGKVSKILRHRIESFSTDRLVGYLQILYPEMELKVA